MRHGRKGKGMTEEEIDARLKKCTKAELLHIIDSFRRHSLGSADWILDMAISDLAFEKEQHRFDEADRINEEIKETDDQYRALLASYDGKKLGEIPISIVNRAAVLAKKSRELNERWFRLMGIDVSGEEVLP